MKKCFLFILISFPLLSFGQITPTSDGPGNISKADKQALELMFGPSIVKDLHLDAKFMDKTKGVEFNLFTKNSKDKIHSKWSKVGNTEFFNFCVGFVDMVEEVVLDDKELKGTFETHSTDYKLIKSVLHKFGEKLSLVEPCSEDEFIETTPLAKKEFSFSMATVKSLGKDKVLAAVQQCRSQLPTFFPAYQEEANQERLKQIEIHLKAP